MSVVKAVSFPDDMYKELVERGYSFSKVAQIGGQVVLKGGIEALKDTEDLQKQVDHWRDKFTAEKDRNARILEELAYCRERLVKAEDNLKGVE